MQSKRRVGPTNPLVASLAESLRKIAAENDAGVWRSISESLEKPRRRRVELNISKIARYTEENDTVVVPGKVLATGELYDKSVTVAALGFSKRARSKIEAANGRALSIQDLVEENPSGSGVRILN